MQTGRNIVGKQVPTLLGQQCFELLRQFARSLSNDSPLLYSFTCGKREEKSLRHVATVAKFWMTTNRKQHLKLIKSEFALFQTSTTLFNFI